MTHYNEREELQYYLELHYPVTVHKDPEGGFSAEIEELPGCITQGETAEEVIQSIEDARIVWIETAYEDGLDIPIPRSADEYKGKFVVRIPRSVHRDLVRLAKQEGVSLNQYVSTILSAGVSRNKMMPEIDAMLMQSRFKELSSGLAVYGTSQNSFDYDELQTKSSIISEGKN